jgi:hypothetical protein
MGMFDETSLPAAYFPSASNAAHAAFTGLFSLRRVQSSAVAQMSFSLENHSDM